MSNGVIFAIFAIFAVIIAVLMIVVGFIGNKAVRKKNFDNPSEPEKLADRFEKGRKS